MMNPMGNVPNGIGNSNYQSANPKVTMFYHHNGATNQQQMYQSDGESGIIS
jgi:hypothetical protein